MGFFLPVSATNLLCLGELLCNAQDIHSQSQPQGVWWSQHKHLAGVMTACNCRLADQCGFDSLLVECLVRLSSTKTRLDWELCLALSALTRDLYARSSTSSDRMTQFWRAYCQLQVGFCSHACEQACMRQF